MFHNPNTGKPWSSDLVIRARWWTNTIKASGVRHRKPSNTRHSYASTMLSGGEQTWWVVEQMGHTTPEMVFKNYAKWIPDETGGYTLEGDW